MFLAEKGLEVQLVPVNLFGMEQLSPEYLAINPDGTVPLLETDEGVFLSETVAICHYLEQLKPDPALMGKTVIEQAQVLMWNNIVEQQGMFAIAETLRNWSPGFRNRVFAGQVDYPQMPELIARGRTRMEQFFDRVNVQLTGRAFLATEDYTLADISLLAMTEFAGWVECEPTASRRELARWHAKAMQRPSATA
jgi:glutathione S-transferase